MSLDDCFLPLPSPLYDYAPTPYARWRRGSHSADSGKVSGGRSHGEKGVQRRTLQIHDLPVAVPPKRPPPPLGPLPVFKENLNVAPEEPKQYNHYQAAVSRVASKGRYARLKKNLLVLPEGTKQQHHSQVAVSHCVKSCPQPVHAIAVV